MRWTACLVLLAAAAFGCEKEHTDAPAATVLDPTPLQLELDAISGADPVFLTAPSGARPARAKTAEAEVVAKLVSREGPVPHCGILYAIEGMTFEVRETLDGSIGRTKSLSLAVGCPEMPPGGAIEQFEIGATYRLRLSQSYPARVRAPAIDRADYWLEHIELAR